MITEADIGGVHIKDTSYTRRSPVDLGAAVLDFIDGENWVHEVKSSSGPTLADQAQVIHYCYRLRQVGIASRGGILHYPKTRRTLRLEYGQAQETQASNDIAAAIDVLTAGQSPPRLNRAACRGCSYLAYCWSAG